MPTDITSSVGPSRRRTKEQVAELYVAVEGWYNEGYNDVEIALKSGFSNRTVRRWRASHGLPANPVDRPRDQEGRYR